MDRNKIEYLCETAYALATSEKKDNWSIEQLLTEYDHPFNGGIDDLLNLYEFIYDNYCIGSDYLSDIYNTEFLQKRVIEFAQQEKTYYYNPYKENFHKDKSDSRTIEVTPATYTVIFGTNTKAMEQYERIAGISPAKIQERKDHLKRQDLIKEIKSLFAKDDTRVILKNITLNTKGIDWLSLQNKYFVDTYLKDQIGLSVVWIDEYDDNLDYLNNEELENAIQLLKSWLTYNP